MPTIWGTNSDDVLRGTNQSDVVWGLEGLDTFYWRDGMGSDTYHGGLGGERFDANPYSPGNPGGDRLFLEGTRGATITMTATDSGQVRIGDDTLSFTGIERIHGTSGDDFVFARDAGLNASGRGMPGHGISIFTGAGNDSIVGSRYDDIIDGGSGNDTIRAGGGDDFIHSSTGNDLIYGGAGNENIRWGNGDSQHNPGNDTIHGGAGHDLINIWIKRGDLNPQNEAAGIDGASVIINAINAAGTFSGTARSDIFASASLRFTGFELGWTHSGNDTIDASGASVSSTGMGVNFNARWGNDLLIGSRGNDTLDGCEGRDTIRGGQGNDAIWAGNGTSGDGYRDVLIFRAGDGRDTVYGFERGLDVLDLGGRRYSTMQTQDGTLLNLGGGDSVLLDGVFDFT